MALKVIYSALYNQSISFTVQSRMNPIQSRRKPITYKGQAKSEILATVVELGNC